MHYVYGLFDPRTKELKYIGYSSQQLRARLNQHCQPSRLKANSHKNNWIKSLQQINLIPEIYSLEEYHSEQEALIAEVELISYYRYIGAQLTNVTKGGDKGAIYLRTTKIKNKISQASKNRKHSEQTKIKISNSLKGIKRNHSQEHKQKISSTLKNKPAKLKSLETRNKLRNSKLGTKLTEETKAKAVANNKRYKLTKLDIANIKALYQSNNYTFKDLSKIYNVSQSQIYRVVNNQSGKYLQ